MAHTDLKSEITQAEAALLVIKFLLGFTPINEIE